MLHVSCNKEMSDSNPHMQAFDFAKFEMVFRTFSRVARQTISLRFQRLSDSEVYLHVTEAGGGR